MEVTYRMNPSDLEALTAFVYRGTIAGWFLRGWFWVLALGLAVFLGAQFDADEPTLSLVPIVIAAGLLLFLWRRRHRGVRTRRPSLFEPLTLALAPDALRSRGAGRSATIEWWTVSGFGETPAHIFIMLDRASGYAVPKRDLSPDDAHALVAELARYTHALPSAGSVGTATTVRVVRVVLVALIVLTVIYYAWHFALLQKPR